MSGQRLAVTLFLPNEGIVRSVDVYLANFLTRIFSSMLIRFDDGAKTLNTLSLCKNRTCKG